MNRLCLLLLLPAIVSFAPPRKIPDPLRYENASGDVFEIADWWKGDPGVFVEMEKKQTGCNKVFAGRADRQYGNRYVLKTTETEMLFRVSERRVRIIRIDQGPLNSKACNKFKGVYKRIKEE